MSAGTLASLNGISTRATIKPGQKLKVSGAAATVGGKTHKVRNGDTIWDISRKYGVSMSSLLRANNLSRRSVIKPGQHLVIPAGGSA
jgi:membrane-bound lytic murein transglycosylase D